MKIDSNGIPKSVVEAIVTITLPNGVDGGLNWTLPEHVKATHVVRAECTINDELLVPEFEPFFLLYALPHSKPTFLEKQAIISAMLDVYHDNATELSLAKRQVADTLVSIEFEEVVSLSDDGVTITF